LRQRVEVWEHHRRGNAARAMRLSLDWACIFGAVCPTRGAGAALVLPYANAEAMNLHWPRSAAASCPALTPWSRRMGLGGISKAAA
jgi:hypothetical protein